MSCRACRRHLASSEVCTWNCGITWLANRPTGWVSRLTKCVALTPWMCHSHLLLGFSVATICCENNKMRRWKGEALVTECAGHEPRWVFSYPVYSNNSLLGKSSKWLRAIAGWTLISAFLVKMKGHLEVLRDAVICSVPLLEFLSRIPVSFCPSLSLPFHLSPSFLSFHLQHDCLSLKLPPLFSLTVFHHVFHSLCLWAYSP